jgi:acetylornithine deacetylase
MCHTDTVPYSVDWKEAVDPFVADGFLYGCGACDVKGFLACLLISISETKPTDLIDGLRLILTADEEVGCIGAKHLSDSGWLVPKRLIIGEPTSLHPARAGKGYCLAEVTVFGTAAHSAHPEKESPRSITPLDSSLRSKSFLRNSRLNNTNSFIRISQP